MTFFMFCSCLLFCCIIPTFLWKFLIRFLDNYTPQLLHWSYMHFDKIFHTFYTVPSQQFKLNNTAYDLQSEHRRYNRYSTLAVKRNYRFVKGNWVKKSTNLVNLQNPPFISQHELRWIKLSSGIVHNAFSAIQYTIKLKLSISSTSSNLTYICLLIK